MTRCIQAVFGRFSTQKCTNSYVQFRADILLAFCKSRGHVLWIASPWTLDLQIDISCDCFDFNERTQTADAAYPADAAHRTQQTTIATTSLIDSALATMSQAIVNRLRKKKADVSPAAMVSATLTPSPLLPPLRPNKASYRSFSGYAMRKQNPCTYATGQCIRRWQRWRVCLLMLMLYSC